MPEIGTIVRAQLRNGFLLSFGDPYPNLCNLPAEKVYQGRIIGIWQVPGNDFEPAQIDALAVPEEIFKAFIGLGRGADPEATLAKMQADAVAAHAARKAAPSAMRLSQLMTDGPVAFYEASLSMPEAMTHYLDRNTIAQLAYDEDDGDDDGDEAESPAVGATPATQTAPTMAPALGAMNGQPSPVV